MKYHVTGGAKVTNALTSSKSTPLLGVAMAAMSGALSHDVTMDYYGIYDVIMAPPIVVYGNGRELAEGQGSHLKH